MGVADQLKCLPRDYHLLVNDRKALRDPVRTESIHPEGLFPNE